MIEGGDTDVAEPGVPQAAEEAGRRPTVEEDALATGAASGTPDTDDSDDAPPRGPTGLPRRIVDLFFSPGVLFEELRDRPVWGAALAVAMGLAVVTTVLIPTDLITEMIRQQIRDAGQTVPPNLDFATGITRFTMPVVSAVTVALWAFGVSAILTFVFAFVLGDDGRYRQYLAVNCHALLVSSFGSLATLPLRIAERDLQLNLSLGTFALFLDDGYWLSFLTLMDLFVLWTLVLVALGVSKLHTGRSWASATATVLGIWALAASGIAAIMS